MQQGSTHAERILGQRTPGKWRWLRSLIVWRCLLSCYFLFPLSYLFAFFFHVSLSPPSVFFFYPNLFSTDLWGFCFLHSSLCDSADVQYWRQRVIKRCDNRQNKSIGAWEHRQEQPHCNIWLQFTTSARPRYKRSLLLPHLNLNLLKLQLWYYEMELPRALHFIRQRSRLKNDLFFWYFSEQGEHSSFGNFQSEAYSFAGCAAFFEHASAPRPKN